jgi:glycosyltransferase involved in cell wall biosynthesis
MLKNRNIVCFSNDWRNDPTSKHQIMKLLAKENTILWVNSIGLRNPGLKSGDIKRGLGKLRSFFGGIEQVADRLFVFTPIVIPFHHLAMVRAINGMMLKLSLSHYTKKLGMRDIIYWSYLPNVAYLLKRLKPKMIVYHCVDEWSKFSFIDDRIIHDEQELCRISDIVFASARSLYESRKRYNPNTFYISHGVDYDYFHAEPPRNQETPEDIAKIPRPIAGFFGLIHEWIDLALLDYLIRNNPRVSFVFIGKHSVDVKALTTHPNAFFLGQKEYAALLAYARHFDVGLIPFKMNELTINVNPIKLKEYLALGIPVVSVGLPEVRAYRSIVRIAETYQEFNDALNEELAGRHLSSREERDLVARQETWERKIEEMSSLIVRHAKGA